MTETPDYTDLSRPSAPAMRAPYAVARLVARAVEQRYLLGAAALVLGGLVLLFGLPVWPAALGWLALAAIALANPGAETAPALPVPALPVVAAGAAPVAGARVPVALIAAVDVMPQACMLLDLKGQLITQNAFAARLTTPVPKGEHVSHALRAPDVLQAINEAARERQAKKVSYFELVPVRRWLEAHVLPVMPDFAPEDAASGAGPGYLLLLLTDLTEHQRLERMRADFVANASHELRTPLASILGFIETLQGPAQDDPAAQKQFLDVMLGQAQRMSRLINDLMSLSRIELNAHVFPDTPVELRGVIGHVVDALGVVAREANVTLDIHCDAADGYMVLGEADELTRVFENLIENAIKYGAAGGRVDITLERMVEAGEGDEDGQIVALVRDHGEGIPPEHLPRLTERFYRVDVAHSREKGGTGLGLAIVKHIINRHRGTLAIDSRPGEGATFTVRLAAAS